MSDGEVENATAEAGIRVSFDRPKKRLNLEMIVSNNCIDHKNHKPQKNTGF